MDARQAVLDSMFKEPPLKPEGPPKTVPLDLLLARHWNLVTMAGFYTWPHHDANGLCTWGSVQGDGAKLWGIITFRDAALETSTSTEKMLALMESLTLASEGKLVDKEKFDIFVIELRRGDTM